MGVPGSALRLAEKLQSGQVSSLRIQRPQEMNIVLSKLGRELGLDMYYLPTSKTVMITGVNEGLIHEWNGWSTCEEVELGDRLFQVNGIRDHPERMVAECRRAEH